MPRYHFNVYDGRADLDTDGSMLPDLRSARLQGVKCFASLIAEKAEDLLAEQDWRMEVTDGRGMMLYRFDFTLTESPAAKTQ